MPVGGRPVAVMERTHHLPTDITIHLNSPDFNRKLLLTSTKTFKHPKINMVFRIFLNTETHCIRTLMVTKFITKDYNRL